MVRSSQQSLAKQRVFAYHCTENQYYIDSNVMASAVYHRLSNTDKSIKRIGLIADGCGGQNKSCIVVGTCKWLLENPAIKTIELVFGVIGKKKI